LFGQKDLAVTLDGGHELLLSIGQFFVVMDMWSIL
jgi:hypothetical protein